MKKIFFDLDGTLLNINERWYGLHLDLSSAYKYQPMPKKEYIALKRAGCREKDIMLKTGILPENIDSYIKERKRNIEFKNYLEKDEVKPGVHRLLEGLSRSHALILLTKRRKKKNCQEEIDRFSINSYFSKIIIAGSLSKQKAAEKFLDTQLCRNDVLIGDTEDDYVAAKKLGVKSILICDGARNKEYLSNLKPDFILNNLQELIGIL